jgi:2-keto-3-deoxy-L-arabinonate dehydratase
MSHVAGRVPVIVTTSHFSTRIAMERSAKRRRGRGGHADADAALSRGAAAADEKGMLEHFSAWPRQPASRS